MLPNILAKDIGNRAGCWSRETRYIIGWILTSENLRIDGSIYARIKKERKRKLRKGSGENIPLAIYSSLKMGSACSKRACLDLIKPSRRMNSERPESEKRVVQHGDRACTNLPRSLSREYDFHVTYPEKGGASPNPGAGC